MTEASLDRRRLLAAGATLGVCAVAGRGSEAVAAATVPAAAGRSFSPQPLPFNPATIPGLSEKLLVSHHDNNYVGEVKRLGAITAQLASLDPATAPGFTLSGLKREELIAWNSMILHELYFAGFGTATAPAAPLAEAIERDFGSFDRGPPSSLGSARRWPAAPAGCCSPGATATTAWSTNGLRTTR